MKKQQALDLLHAHMQSVNLRRHCYAVGAVMKMLAQKLNGDPEKWEVVGILHDGDYEGTKNDPQKHTLLMHQWLTEAGVTDREILSAILSHNYAHTGQNAPQNRLEWSLFCCDELTGLVIAVALVKLDPSSSAAGRTTDGQVKSKLQQVTRESILKKWKIKAFAAGVKREQIAMCEEKLGIQLNEFIQIALSAMQEIHQELGL